MTDKLDDAVRPVAWASQEHLDALDGRGVLAKERTMRGGRTVPLYPPSAIAHLQARVDSLIAEIARVTNQALESMNRSESAKQRLADANARVEALTGEVERLGALYHDLLYQVASKFPGESRHDTAKRYINQFQNMPAAGASSTTQPEADQ